MHMKSQNQYKFSIFFKIFPYFGNIKKIQKKGKKQYLY